MSVTAPGSGTGVAGSLVNWNSNTLPKVRELRSPEGARARPNPMIFPANTGTLPGSPNSSMCLVSRKGATT
jgi:hypothetical protein